jgi:hypothetical protein
MEDKDVYAILVTQDLYWVESITEEQTSFPFTKGELNKLFKKLFKKGDIFIRTESDIFENLFSHESKDEDITLEVVNDSPDRYRKLTKNEYNQLKNN